MNYKKTITIIKYSVIILFAILGIGMVGGIPVQTSNKNENSIELIAELTEESNDEEDKALDLIIKQ